MSNATGAGTKTDPWKLHTPPGTAEYDAWRDAEADPPALVVQVGKTQLRYHLRCLDDLHAMLLAHGDWLALGSADEQKPAAEGTVEAWGRAATNPVQGWYGLKKGLRGRFGMYVPPLRPWLFRIAHNAAMDHLKSHGHARTDAHASLDDLAAANDGPDPAIVRAALAHFVALPTAQRCAVILKDVLGHSLEETAETMGVTVMSVKASLVRGRAALRATEAGAATLADGDRAALDRYAARFNARDWDGVRALVGDDCRLDLVAIAHRRGKEVGRYFGRYEREAVTLRVGRLEGAWALGAYVGDATQPAYFILLGWEGDRVATIRDYRYVPYLAAEAAWAPA